MSIRRIGVIAVENPSGETGGAERLCHALVSALRTAGFEASLVEALGDELTFEGIQETYLRCYDLDVSAYDAVISTKAPTYAVRHPNHVCYLVHTMRVFYDLWETELPHATEEQRRQRRLIHQLDSAALRPPRTRRIFSIGNEVSKRLQRWNGLDSEVLHPPLALDRFRSGGYGDHLLLPGRLHRWKRVGLAIRAMSYVRHPVRLVITGTGEQESELRALAAGNERIELRGQVSDDELIDLYASALGVLFVPLREDYGYVAIEAFWSGKAVITCRDSGEPALFVRHGVNGFVCDPEPKELASAIDRLCEDRETARQLGERGRAGILHLQWPAVVEKLTAALDS